MSNPSRIDYRFDKPAHESVVDLINETNRTFIKANEIEADQIQAVTDPDMPNLINTQVRIRLKGAQEKSPFSILYYRRLDLGKFLGDRGPLAFDTDVEDFQIEEVFAKIKAQFHVELSTKDAFLYREYTDVASWLVVTAYAHNPVFTGKVRIPAVAPDHLSWVVPAELDGLERAQVAV